MLDSEEDVCVCFLRMVSHEGSWLRTKEKRNKKEKAWAAEGKLFSSLSLSVILSFLLSVLSTAYRFSSVASDLRSPVCVETGGCRA